MLCLTKVQNNPKKEKSPTENIFQREVEKRTMRDVYEDILTLKIENSPVFSGDFGMNIFKNNQYLMDMFKDLPYEPVVNATI